MNVQEVICKSGKKCTQIRCKVTCSKYSTVSTNSTGLSSGLREVLRPLKM